jgi:hypothetical protein
MTLIALEVVGQVGDQVGLELKALSAFLDVTLEPDGHQTK